MTLCHLSLLSPLSSSLLQYVSALRPPKKRHRNTSTASVDSEEDVWSSERRRSSVVLPRPLTRGTFQNTSLPDFSNRVRPPAGGALERRKRLALQGAAYGGSQQTLGSTAYGGSQQALSTVPGIAASQDSTDSTDNSEEEWKQVREGASRRNTQVLSSCRSVEPSRGTQVLSICISIKPSRGTQVLSICRSIEPSRGTQVLSICISLELEPSRGTQDLSICRSVEHPEEHKSSLSVYL